MRYTQIQISDRYVQLNAIPSYNVVPFYRSDCVGSRGKNPATSFFYLPVLMGKKVK